MDFKKIKFAVHWLKGQRLGVVEQKGKAAFFVPYQVNLFADFADAVNNFRLANDTAAWQIRDVFRHPDAKVVMHSLTQLRIFLLIHVWLVAGMHEKSAAKVRRPRAVFKRFKPVDNEPCPGLPNAKRFHALSITGL